MTGLTNYDILSNTVYTDLFQYLPIYLRSTPEEFVFSDKIGDVLNTSPHNHLEVKLQESIIKKKMREQFGKGMKVESIMEGSS